MVTTARNVDAPAITPLSGTLLDVASISEGIEWIDPDGGLFESYNCLTTDRAATWPCPEVFLDAPTDAAATTETTGGTLPADTYFFTVTALSPLGETVESNEATVTTTGATSTIEIVWATVPNATGYRIYGTSGASGSETFLTEVDGALSSDYTWTGSPALGSGQPPSENSAVVAEAKTFEHPQWLDGVRFAVYAGVECKPFGLPELAKAQAVFEARESFGVERALMETLFQGATDLTPAAGAVTPEVGLAILEGHAATEYAGVPTIHAPRSIGSILMTRTAAHAEAGKFYSEQGSKLASGGGYNATNLSPAGAAPAAGSLWMYATGEVAVARGKVIAKEALDQSNNEDFVLVERPYVAALDCYRSAVRVTVS